MRYTCVKCGDEQDKDDFYYDKQGYRDKTCRFCRIEHQKLVRKAQGNAKLNYYHANRLRKLYGLTVKEWEAMYAKQEGKCLVCGIHQDELTQSLVVDHNHVTRKVRGLLCRNCNVAIGLLGDNVKTVLAAARYLMDRDN